MNDVHVQIFSFLKSTMIKTWKMYIREASEQANMLNYGQKRLSMNGGNFEVLMLKKLW